jgi:hypothetical protein
MGVPWLKTAMALASEVKRFSNAPSSAALNWSSSLPKNLRSYDFAIAPDETNA